MTKNTAFLACNVHRFTVAVQLSTLLVLAITGCGGAPPPASIRDFSAALNQVECQARFKCCPSVTMKYANEAACEAAMNNDAQAKIVTVEADIAAGQARYDQAAAGRVLDTARAWTASCDHPVDVHEFGVELGAVVVGTQPLGAPCMDGHTQCASNNCVNGACAAAPMKSTPLADGQPCAHDGDCASNKCQTTCQTVPVSQALCALP